MSQVLNNALAASVHASSTGNALAVSWPYAVFSVIVIFGLVGTAKRMLRK